jgi:hypothetical protein
MGTQVAVAAERAIPSSLAVLPVMDVAMAIARRRQVISLVKSELWNPETDSGAVPGSEKQTLRKPGAEKLVSFFGLSPRFPSDKATIVEDWTGTDHGGEPIFYYRFTCELWRGDRCIAEADGSCNSWESKYRYRWVAEADVPFGTDKANLKRRIGSISEFAFAVDKAETSGKYGKPAEYWQQFTDAIASGKATKVKKALRSGEQRDAWVIDTTLYRIPNDDIASQVNTVLKMAQKRALVAVTLIAVNASEFFTQDLEDFEEEGTGTVVEGTARVGAATAPTPPESPALPPQEGDGNGHDESSSSGARSPAPAQPKGNVGWDTWGKGRQDAFWVEAGKIGLDKETLHREFAVGSMTEYIGSNTKAMLLLHLMDHGFKQALTLDEIHTALDVGFMNEFDGDVAAGHLLIKKYLANVALKETADERA